uniref:Protein IQ-DOMAIN 1-like n=1 Tax=Nelumbo nucifera TaxID=4432 RepID=A0A822ZZS3_NELNU|nr:TPA_asm: hypothetical protein HUJ06_018253 [Nelumbo nucifera]
MGGSGKWLRTIVGLRKSEKAQSSEKEGNKTAAGGRFWHRRKQSVEIDFDILNDECAQNAALLTGRANDQSNSDSIRSPASSFQVQPVQVERNTKEEWAATRIQTAFRGFLEGWCDSIGSVEEIQTKLIKRKEAAAKRERAMAYALSHQWQAGSRQQSAPAGFEPDKSNWGWNWLERWMAVRPWENRFLDINVRDGVIIHENGSVDGKNGTKTQFRSAGKKLTTSNLQSNIQKTVTSHSDGSGSSSSKSTSLLATSNMLSVKPMPKPPQEEPIEEASSQPSGVGPRSYSNPKERPTQQDAQAKKRLSLPSSGLGPETARRPSRSALGRTPVAQNTIKENSRLKGRHNSNPTSAVPQGVELQI